MNRFVALLKLTRIEHSAILVAAVIAAELIAGSGSLPGAFPFAMSLVAPIFVSMAAFAINDYYDMSTDKLNKRTDRPLVSGSLKPRSAVYVTIISLAIGIAAGLLINLYSFIIVVIFGALAVLYSYRLKETLFWGNAYVAFSMSIPFLFGNYVVSSELFGSIVLIFLMIFLSGLAREIQGTIRDYKGDTMARNANTIPRHIGKTGAAALALVLYIAAIAISIYLFLYVAPFEYNLVYAMPIALCDAMLIYTAAIFLSGNAKLYGVARNTSLAAMATALLAILAAPLI